MGNSPKSLQLGTAFASSSPSRRVERPSGLTRIAAGGAGALDRDPGIPSLSQTGGSVAALGPTRLHGDRVAHPAREAAFPVRE